MGSLTGFIRDARLVPYQAIIGEREAATGQVALRLRGGRRLPARHVAPAIAAIAAQMSVHSPDLWVDADVTGAGAGPVRDLGLLDSACHRPAPEVSANSLASAVNQVAACRHAQPG